MPYKTGGGGQPQEYDGSNGRYGCGGFAFEPLGITLSSRARETFAESQARHLKKWIERFFKDPSIPTQIKKKVNTATVVYDFDTKKRFYGINKGILLTHAEIHPWLLESPGRIVSPPSGTRLYPAFNCAEIDAVNNALLHGSKLSSLSLYTIYIGGVLNHKPKKACYTCTALLNGKVHSNLTGWYSLENDNDE